MWLFLLLLIAFPIFTIGAVGVLEIILLMVIGFIIILAIFEWVGYIIKGKEINGGMRGMYSLKWNSEERYIRIREINFKSDGICDVLLMKDAYDGGYELKSFEQKYYLKKDVCYEINRNEIIINVPRSYGYKKETFIRGNDYILTEFNKIEYEKIVEDESLILKFLKEKEKENIPSDKLDKLKLELVLPGTFGKVGDKKKLDAIRRVLQRNIFSRPLLSCFSPIDDGVVFTDSYQLYKLNDEYLSFDVAFTSDYPNYKREKYLEKFKLEKMYGEYPRLINFIPKELPLERVKVDIKEFLEEYKQTKSDGMRKVMNIKTEKFGDIYYNGDFLKNAIAILKLKKEVELEIYGELRPFVIHNKDNELAVIMPIKNKK